MKHYELNDTENVLIIKNWQGREDLQFVQTLKVTLQKTGHEGKGLFDTICEIFKP